MFVEHIAANGVVFWVSRLEEAEAVEAVVVEDRQNIWLYTKMFHIMHSDNNSHGLFYDWYNDITWCLVMLHWTMTWW